MFHSCSLSFGIKSGSQDLSLSQLLDIMTSCGGNYRILSVDELCYTTSVLHFMCDSALRACEHMRLWIWWWFLSVHIISSTLSVTDFVVSKSVTEKAHQVAYPCIFFFLPRTIALPRRLHCVLYVCSEPIHAAFMLCGLSALLILKRVSCFK